MAVLRSGYTWRRPMLDVEKHSDLVYDVGMHRGEDASFYLKKGFRVVAFEADPDLAAACRERFGDALAACRLTVVEGAIAPSKSTDATISFYKNEGRSVWGTTSAEWAERNAKFGAESRVINVPAVDFGAALSTYGMPHYMKIDVEGCDMLCVETLRDFRQRPNYLSIESDKSSFAAIEREIEVLVELGYDAFQAVEQSAVRSYRAFPNPPREGRYVEHQFERGASGVFGAELGPAWASKEEILRKYWAIRAGYFLLGDSGVMKRWTSAWGKTAQSIAREAIGRYTKAAVPGWYDTHARHSSVSAASG